MPAPTADSPEQIGNDPAAAGALRLSPTSLLMLVATWIVLLGLLVLVSRHAPVTGPAKMSWPRATFFVLNAASLTGFDTTWAPAGGLTRTHAGVAILAMLATALLSVAITTAAYVRICAWDWTWRKIWNASALFVGALLVVACVFEIVGGGSFSTALWNACVVTTAGGMIAGDGSSAAPTLWYGRFPLAFVAAIGPFVLIDTVRRRGDRLTRVSQLTWLAVPLSFVGAMSLVVMTSMLGVLGTLPDWSLPSGAALPAAIAATEASGAGFTDAAAQLSQPARWSLIPVLLLGGASGGIGGGIKAITAAVLVIGLYRLFRGAVVGRTFVMAALLLVCFVALFGATFLLLLEAQPQLRADRTAVLAAAACGNTGLSIDPVAATASDAYVLAAAMLLGRALPWVFLWWSATSGDEPVAVG